MLQEKTKAEIRHLIKVERSKLSTQEIEEASKKISAELFRHKAFIEADSVYLYASFEKEIQTDYIWKKARELGKIVCYPKIEENHKMNFYRVNNEEDLVLCRYGKMSIREPDITYCEKRMPNKQTLIIVPGLAFDRNGHRVGYGGGFYDCYLAGHSYGQTISLCMSFQVLDTIPHDEHDRRVDCIISDKGILY